MQFFVGNGIPVHPGMRIVPNVPRHFLVSSGFVFKQKPAKIATIPAPVVMAPKPVEQHVNVQPVKKVAAPAPVTAAAPVVAADNAITTTSKAATEVAKTTAGILQDIAARQLNRKIGTVKFYHPANGGSTADLVGRDKEHQRHGESGGRKPRQKFRSVIISHLNG